MLGDLIVSCHYPSMKNSAFALLLLLCLTTIPPFPPSQAADSPPTFKASDTQSLIAKNGQKVSVFGTVSSVRKSNSGTNFINFENSDFYLVTFDSDLIAFENGAPADLYQGKRLAVTGVISLYQGKAQIKLNHPDMVKIITADTALPKPKKAQNPKQPKTQPQNIATDKAPPEKKKKTTPVDSKKYFK